MAAVDFAATPTTTSDNSNFSPALYARIALEQAKNKLFARQFFEDYSDLYNGEGQGASVTIPVEGDFTATSISDGANVTLTAATQGTPKTITLNRHYHVAFIIPDAVKAKAREIMQKKYIDRAVYACQKEFDEYIHSLASGSSLSTVAATTNTGDNLLANFATVRGNLNTADEMTDVADRAWFIDHTLETRMFTISGFSSRDNVSDQPLESGHKTKPWLGSPLVPTNGVASATVSGVTTHNNYCAHKSAIGYIIALDNFEEQRVLGNLGTLFVSNIFYGATLVYPHRINLLTHTVS